MVAFRVYDGGQARMSDVRRVKSLAWSGAQLVAGWVGLALSTAALRLVPDFPVFSVVDQEAEPRHHGRRAPHHRATRRHDNAVGMWVVAASSSAVRPRAAVSRVRSPGANSQKLSEDLS